MNKHTDNYLHQASQSFDTINEQTQRMISWMTELKSALGNNVTTLDEHMNIKQEKNHDVHPITLDIGSALSYMVQQGLQLGNWILLQPTVNANYRYELYKRLYLILKVDIKLLENRIEHRHFGMLQFKHRWVHFYVFPAEDIAKMEINRLKHYVEVHPNYYQNITMAELKALFTQVEKLNHRLYRQHPEAVVLQDLITFLKYMITNMDDQPLLSLAYLQLQQLIVDIGKVPSINANKFK